MLFVLLWSSGFIAAKAGLAYAETLTFLSLRYAVVTVLMTGVALAMRATWPNSWREIGHIAMAGVLLQAVYFGAVWLAMAEGIGAGETALIVCLQPVITAALVGPLLGERVRPRQWLGLALGLAGVTLVVANRLALEANTLTGVAFAFIGLAAITAGMLYQKKFCPNMDPRAGPAIQFLIATLVLTPVAFLLEDGIIDWTPQFIASLAYIVVVLSLFSMILLTIMIRRGQASQVTTWFFLVPPCATLLGYLVLGEPIGLTASAGMIVAAAGVALVMLPERGRR